MKWLLRVNWLGIDVALGAGALSYALSLAWDRILHWHSYFPLVVWMIYALDHLRDVYTHRELISTARREFHSKFHKNILKTMAVVVIIAFSLLTRLEIGTLIPGLLLAAVVGVYFLFLQILPSKMAFVKELAAAMFYTLGICLIPFAAGPAPQYFYIHVLQVFMLALVNLILFSWFDFDDDKEEGFVNMVSTLGHPVTKRIIQVMLLVNILSAALLIYLEFQPVMEVCFLIMNAVLLLTVINPVYWSKNYRFRIAGDAIFFMPLLITLDGKF